MNEHHSKARDLLRPHAGRPDRRAWRWLRRHLARGEMTMADRHIDLKPHEVRAVLAGQQTQTRRVLKPQPPEWRAMVIDITKPCQNESGEWGQYETIWSSPLVIGMCEPERDEWRPLKGLRYRPGDRLWVREAWKPGAWREDGRVAIDYRASPELTNTPWVYRPLTNDFYDQEAKWTAELEVNGSVADERGFHHWQAGKSPLRWRQPIHMPRWASRLTLTVIDVRVQRLQDISEADAIAEGCTGCLGPNPDFPDEWDPAPAEEYRDLWGTINGPGSWDANPWVMVISFTVQRGNIDVL